MSITLETLNFLASHSGSNLLEKLAHEDLSDRRTLRLLTALRREFTPQQAGAALEMARLRIKAAGKFGEDAARLFFTADALEQASDPLARRYRTETVYGGSVLDACCGTGTDSLALARTAASVLGLDIDPVRIAAARLNAAVLGITNVQFEAADVRQGLPCSPDLLFYDPARRDSQGKRIFDVERYDPPLSLVRGWQAARIVVKLSPGVDLAQLADYGGLVEFISVKGDLKEAVLRLGEGESGLRATLLAETAVYHWRRGDSPGDVATAAPRAWLVEPDPAVLRAGLVKEVAAKFRGTLLDNTIAYFTTDAPPDSVWTRAWKILDWMPFHVKRLRAYLRERHVGQVTVKKRGSPVPPETLIPQLKLSGDQSRTLVLTRLCGQPVTIICADV